MGDAPEEIHAMPRRSTRASAALVCATLVATFAAPRDSAAGESPPTRAEGQALLAKNDFAGAEAVFARLVELDDTDADAWFLLGYARHARGEFRSALVAHRRAAGFPRRKAIALFNVTCAHARLGETDDALAAFGEAVAAGFRDRGLVATDPDLESIRGDARLAKVLKPLLRGADAFVEPVRILHEIDGETAGEQFGWVARAVGDLDGDGATDFAATAPTRGAGAGRVSVHSSKTGRRLLTADGRPGDGLGMSVAPAGDVDGDGTPDIVAGAPQGANAPGYAIVISGSTGTEILRVAGDAPGDQFGVMVCGAGDIDSDGRAEIVVSAFRADGKAGADAGRVTVHSGRTGAVLVRLDGERAGDLFGSAVDVAGVDDERFLAIGAMDAGPGSRGRVHVHRLGAKVAAPHFTIEAGPTGVHLGQYFVAFAGDVDGDGTPDVAASDFSDAVAGQATGRVVVASGRDGARLLDLPGRRVGEGFGTSRSTCGDVDGDGRADLVVGAWQNADGAPSGGRCYVLSGRDGSTLATFTSKMDQDTLGFDAVGLGDVDGDGATDFLLSAAWSEVHGVRTGRVWVVAGAVKPKK